MSDLTKLGDDFDIIEVTVDAKEQAEVMERLEQLERHNELLRAAVLQAKEYEEWVLTSLERESLQDMHDAIKAAMDGGALDKDGEK